MSFALLVCLKAGLRKGKISYLWKLTDYSFPYLEFLIIHSHTYVIRLFFLLYYSSCVVKYFIQFKKINSELSR